MEEKDKFLFEAVVKGKEVVKATDTGEEKRILEAFIATTNKDTDNDVIDESALKDAVDILINKYNTVLYNHNTDKPIGKILDAAVKEIENEKGLWVKTLISKTENTIWTKIQEGVLSKFSFWARIQRVPVYVDEEQTQIDYFRITKLFPYEASLVSVPANPNAVALDWYIEKAFNGGKEMEEDKTKEKETTKAKAKPKVTIDTKEVNHTPWSKVNKTKLGQVLAESGNEKAIREAFAVVPDIKKRSTWKLPHHVLVKTGDNAYEIELSYPGLMAFYKALRGARNKLDVSDAEYKAAVRHAKKHFRQLIAMGEYDEMPDGLKAKVNDALEQLEEKLSTKEETMNELKDILLRMKEADEEELKSLIEDAEGVIEKVKTDEPKPDETPTVEVDYDKIAEVVKGIVEELRPVETDEGNPKDKDADVGNEDAMKEVVDKLQSEIDKLKKELEEIKNEPVVKGGDAQRTEELTDEEKLLKEVRSEEFDKKSPTEQLNVLRKLFDNK